MNLKINLLKDQLRRSHVRKDTKRRHQLKWIIRGVHRKMFIRNYKRKSIDKLTKFVYNKFTYIKPNNSLTRIRNRCTVSGNSSGTSSLFKLSRQSFKEEIKKSQRFVGVCNVPYSKQKTKKLKLHAL